jgi:soluble lytic murein transglycosylase
MTFCPIAKAALAALAALCLVASTAAAAAPPKKPVKAASQPKKTPVAANAKKTVPLPRPRPVHLASLRRQALASAEPVVGDTAPLALTSAEPARPAPGPVAMLATAPVPDAVSPLATPRSPTPAEDLATVKKAVDLIRRGKTGEATQLEKSLNDGVAKKLVEWLILRNEDPSAGFNRYVAFIAANPGWPSLGLLRKRAEGALWEERRDQATVRAFFARREPISAKGRLALARVLLASGEHNAAQRLVRDTWRQDALSRDVETQVLETFGELLTRADHKARMDRRLYADDNEGGLRSAQRLGGAEIAIAKARIAVNEKADGAKALLDAVPGESRGDPGYIFSRVQWLRRNNKLAEAAELLLTAPRDAAVLHDCDEWWTERRVIARKLLDAEDYQAAYRVARDAAPPVKENARAEHQFTAGWIALRFLEDPAAALKHFVHIGDGISNPITLARAGYWQGRALEALGREREARARYEAAARFATAYYGQLARARLGVGELAINPPPRPSAEKRAALLALDVVRAAEMLYAIEARDLVAPMVQDLAERAEDVGALVVLGELAQNHQDARAMLLIGKTLLARGFSFEHFAFPNVGVPKFASVTREIDRSVVYAIVRQESAFQAKIASSANAQGLMQIMPGTGRALARKFGLAFDSRRLASDPVYNAQLGSAELSSLLQEYRGSYVMTFAAYNAGRGSVKKWLAAYGDPRDPKVDPIDWVERIPFSETRNYVQRVMENMQVYRVRLGGSARLMIEADLRKGTPEE